MATLDAPTVRMKPSNSNSARRKNSRQPSFTSARTGKALPLPKVASSSRNGNLKKRLERITLSIDDVESHCNCYGELIGKELIRKEKSNSRLQSLQLGLGDICLASIRRYPDENKVVKRVLQALSMINGNALVYQKYLIEPGLGVEVIKVFDNFLHDPVLLALACDVFAKLLGSPQFLKDCFTAEILDQYNNSMTPVQLFARVMERYLGDATVMPGACKVTRNMLGWTQDNEAQSKAIFDLGIVGLMVEVLNTHTDNRKIHEYGSASIFYFQRHFYSMMALGIDEMLVNSLRKHHLNNTVWKNYRVALKSLLQSPFAANKLFNRGLHDCLRSIAIGCLDHLNSLFDLFKDLQANVKRVEMLTSCIELISTLFLKKNVQKSYLDQNTFLADTELLTRLLNTEYLTKFRLNLGKDQPLHPDFDQLSKSDQDLLKKLKSYAVKCGNWTSTFILLLSRHQKSAELLVANSQYIGLIDLSQTFRENMYLQKNFVQTLAEMLKIATPGNREFLLRADGLQNALFNAQFQFDRHKETEQFDKSVDSQLKDLLSKVDGHIL